MCPWDLPHWSRLRRGSREWQRPNPQLSLTCRASFTSRGHPHHPRARAARLLRRRRQLPSQPRLCHDRRCVAARAAAGGDSQVPVPALQAAAVARCARRAAQVRRGPCSLGCHALLRCCWLCLCAGTPTRPSLHLLCQLLSQLLQPSLHPCPLPLAGRRLQGLMGRRVGWGGTRRRASLRCWACCGSGWVARARPAARAGCQVSCVGGELGWIIHEAWLAA